MTMKILPINVRDAVQVVLRERCIVLTAFVKKRRKINCRHANQEVRKRIVGKKKTQENRRQKIRKTRTSSAK